MTETLESRSAGTAGLETSFLEAVERAVPDDSNLAAHMLPAAAYTSPDVLAWERRHMYAASWTCLGRIDDLLPGLHRLDQRRRKPVTQRAVMVGDVSALLTREGETVRMFANTCRHRGHELLMDGESSERRSITCPYHAWSYDLGGSNIA